jgi:putative restriction endonuclease
LSDLAINNGIIGRPLSSLVDPMAFTDISSKVQQLDDFKTRDLKGNRMYSNALKKFGEYLLTQHQDDVESDIDSILNDINIGETEKNSLIKSRIGQGDFRRKLIKYWSACAVTGFADQRLLIASHIKPWSKASNSERLDVYNGLLLLPNLDKAFDAGFITFDLEGGIQLSPFFTEYEKYGISSEMKVRLAIEHHPYIKYHNTFAFKAN